MPTEKTLSLWQRRYETKNGCERFFTNEKKSLLFLHGYLADSRSFSYQYKEFEKDFDVHKLDFKGFGENKDMQYPYSLDDYCNDVLDYIEKNHLKKPHVIAHSFGGRVAIKLAATNKDLFDKVVLTGAAGLKPKTSVKKLLKRSAFKLAKIFIKKPSLERFYSKDYRAVSPVMQRSFIKIVNEHLDGMLANIINPVLIINGERDKQTPLYTARKLNREIPNSQLVVLKDCGHFCFIDKKTKFNTEVKEFLLS